ncbi:MAG TPA: hypothetical protein VMU79_07325 [Casimicrobiaceae bacterium]|jgi:hypothetical protein|nr:hypothetical protein [Casimicrobiaceae bacterium]
MSERGLGTIAPWAALALGACVVSDYRLDAPRSAAGVEVAPYAVHEECVDLDRGERIGYYFVSVAPVTFNIHFHDSNAVIMPIVRENVTEDSGEFTADRKEIYCLVWEAGAAPTLLEYRIRPIPVKR